MYVYMSLFIVHLFISITARCFGWLGGALRCAALPAQIALQMTSDLNEGGVSPWLGFGICCWQPQGSGAEAARMQLDSQPAWVVRIGRCSSGAALYRDLHPKLRTVWDRCDFQKVDQLREEPRQLAKPSNKQAELETTPGSELH